MEQSEDSSSFAAESGALALGRGLGAPGDAGNREVRLYARYVRALALLCECAPYVDEPSYSEQIDEVLADAATHYPLDWRRSGCTVEVAPIGAGHGDGLCDAVAQAGFGR